jgi:CpeT protein
LIFTVCSGLSAQRKKVSENDLLRLKESMSGAFSNAVQAKIDSAFFHISLRMKPLKMNAARGHWLYVEQAMFNMQEKPYRQRLYRLQLEGDSAISSTVFELPAPNRFTGV